MSEEMNRRIVLARRPKGLPVPDDFRMEQVPIPEPQEGEILLKILFLSLDPYMRFRMNAEKSYAKPVGLGEVMEGGTVAQIIRSRHPDYAEGEFVVSHSGWQSFAISDGAHLRRLDTRIAPLSAALGILGMPGFTAWAGLHNIGRPKPGETVVVAAASGTVGSMVGQIARIKGARAVGIAGSAAKCAYVRDELGFDVAVDHRASNFPQHLTEACPNGIDVYFENVGGAIWDAVFPLLNDFARIPVCGLIADYNSTSTPAEGRDRLQSTMRGILTRSLLVRGFIEREFADQREVFYKEASSWLNEGRLRYREDIVDGLENAIHAFIGLLQGHNFGKLIIRVA